MSTTQNAKSNLASLFWYRGIRQIQDALIPPSSDSQKGYAGILKGMRFLALAPMMSEALCHLHHPTPHCLGKILKLWIHHSSSIRSCGLACLHDQKIMLILLLFLLSLTSELLGVFHKHVEQQYIIHMRNTMYAFPVLSITSGPYSRFHPPGCFVWEAMCGYIQPTKGFYDEHSHKFHEQNLHDTLFLILCLLWSYRHIISEDYWLWG